MRSSTVRTETDAAGNYELELFDVSDPKSVVVCSHGNGVRRWDGERFFYNVAEQYPESAFYLVDQNQLYKDGCKLPSLNDMISRVQRTVDEAARHYPDRPLILLAHSMGCGVAARLATDRITKMIFVSPTAGEETFKLRQRYGEAILGGGEVKTSDGLTKFISREFVASVRGIVWETEYQQLLQRFQPVYAFEAGDEEIVSEVRLTHRNLPFASYKIIPNATHNFHGPALAALFQKLTPLL